MPPPIDFIRTIDAPASAVWQVIVDTHTWPRWGPSVRAVDFPARILSAGAKGRIQTPLGFWLPFAIHTFEPPSYWDWRVGGLMATGHGVQALGPDRCRLTFSVPMWALGYGVICRTALLRIDRLLQTDHRDHRP
jgi:hypothetical protein